VSLPVPDEPAHLVDQVATAPAAAQEGTQTTAIVRAQIAAAYGDLDALRLGLNEELRGVAPIHLDAAWGGSIHLDGQLADLCDSDHPQDKEFRRDFRDDGI
jgi:hypothetical protein